MLSFEERRLLKQRISDIQRAKEDTARRMWVRTLDGDRIYLGGDARPVAEQIRIGYPEAPATDYFRRVA